MRKINRRDTGTSAPASHTGPSRQPTLPWPVLIRGRLIKRYKRFLADIRLDTGETVTAHCPNSGRMTGCAEPGRRVYLSRHDTPRRKLKYTWELIDMPGTLVGVNTLVPNRLVAAAIRAAQVPSLAGYDHITPEVRVSSHTRLDLQLRGGTHRRDCYIEVKNCTLVEGGVAMFPDAVTTRGVKHLHALKRLVAQGHRGGIFYLIQRMDAQGFSPAWHIDPAYGEAFQVAIEGGVEVFAYDVCIDLEGISLGRRVPIHPVD